MPSRRTLLAACGSAVLAGCSTRYTDPSDDATWSQRGRDDARTATRTDGPDSPLTTAWTYDANAGYGSPDCSPVMVDGTVFLAYTEQRADGEQAAVLDAVDAETGARQWTTTVTTTTAQMQETHSHTDSLAIADDAVLLQTANGLVALERGDTEDAGTERWRFDNVGDGQLGSVAAQPGVGDGVVYTGFHRHGREQSEPEFYAIDLEDGELRWRYEIGDWDEYLVYPPAVDDGVVYAAIGGGGVEAIDAADGTELWRERLPVYSAPTVADGSVFVGTAADESGVAALSAETGERRWTRMDDDAVVPSGTAVADGTVYYAAMDRLVARDAATGDSIWTIDGSDSSDEDHVYRGVPTVAGDTLYVTGTSLFAVDREAGELRERVGDVWTRASPAIADDVVIASLEEGTLEALVECRTELFDRCLR
ncbi:outer membrane protein assembly factor BamB family protein [Natronobacterium texcoconense]|uniref:Outer membrane protein assembly factor BamB, contains PQQ-like beta-propeller repeat n=1 Tax=Natronobacterium texcoconense TaxID=1095778 RepID=A0A1H1FNJ9_NATTX|nr:PQQ-binding-like beta-propeller repeat protein [Natronobacterium texcoconense]SDR02490.1 Outer membrane protein assembly factor BamB, contains PQQ-like beta-propeller repeat [Natronobacterium texcoconense]